MYKLSILERGEGEGKGGTGKKRKGLKVKK